MMIILRRSLFYNDDRRFFGLNVTHAVDVGVSPNVCNDIGRFNDKAVGQCRVGDDGAAVVET